MKTQIVTFDVFNTLIHTNPIDIYSRAAHKFGLVGPTKSSFTNAFELKNRLVPHFGKCYRNWWSSVVYDSLAVNNSKKSLDAAFPSIYQDILHQYSLPQSYCVYDEVIPVLEKLKTLNIRSAVISNSDQRTIHILQILQLMHYFSAILLSQVEQVSKPNVRIFSKLFSEFKGIHVGDSIENDYYGSINAGARGILLIRNGLFHDHIDRHDQIQDLNQLLDIL